eukprot:12978378-Alexandrium_andersonii.AAC.1
MSASLVGSEMCIRDSLLLLPGPAMASRAPLARPSSPRLRPRQDWSALGVCLLYTSDAADDM